MMPDKEAHPQLVQRQDHGREEHSEDTAAQGTAPAEHIHQFNRKVVQTIFETRFLDDDMVIRDGQAALPPLDHPDCHPASLAFDHCHSPGRDFISRQGMKDNRSGLRRSLQNLPASGSAPEDLGAVLQFAEFIGIIKGPEIPEAEIR